MKDNSLGSTPPLRHFYFLILFLLVSAGSYAQTGTSVKGSVAAAEGNGLQGVSVNIKGTGTGTTTDAKGNYSLKIPIPNVTLVFSYIGYLPQEIVLNGRAKINITLR